MKAESVGSASAEDDDDDLLLGRDSLGESASSANLVELQAQSTLLRRLDSAFSVSGSGEPAVKQTPPLFELSSHILAQGVSAVVDDSFNRCFMSTEAEEWNWNIYLFPGWLVGVLIRYLVAFPLRLFALVLIFTASALFLGLVKVSGGQCKQPMSCIHSACSPWGAFAEHSVSEAGSPGKHAGAMSSWGTYTRHPHSCRTTRIICSAFVMSWSGVIKFHGTRPKARKGRSPGVYVSNHSSMIDFIILQQSHSYSVVGQKHPGWVGWCQDYLLGGLQPIWFNRGESKNRKLVSDKLKQHAEDPDRLPLLVFPEGTCVNNEYVVEFKKRVFELGVPINPVAIKYNKIFVDGYWNSRAQSFSSYLFSLMTSWAVVCDVWYMDPMYIQPDETAVEFAKRVQVAIARRAGLKPVDWDGYMKYWKPSERFYAARRQQVSRALLKAHDMAPEEWGVSAGDTGGAGPHTDAPNLSSVPAGDLDAAAEALQKQHAAHS